VLFEPNHPYARFAVLLVAMILIALALGGYYIWHLDYYVLPLTQRPLHTDDALLRSSGFLGLRCALTGTLLCAISCLYLLRKHWPAKRRLGPMPMWLDLHILFGWTGTWLIVLHSAGTLRSYLGSLAALSLGVLTVSGCLGRVLAVGGAGPIDCRAQDIPPQSLWMVWRFWHRWAAVLFVCALVGHVMVALGFGDLQFGGGRP
jgi:hypothetical protein